MGIKGQSRPLQDTLTMLSVGHWVAVSHATAVQIAARPGYAVECKRFYYNHWAPFTADIPHEVRCKYRARRLAWAPSAADGLRERLQLKCTGWNCYWRASDAQGVELTREQAMELLQDALGVQVEITD